MVRTAAPPGQEAQLPSPSLLLLLSSSHSPTTTMTDLLYFPVSVCSFGSADPAGPESGCGRSLKALADVIRSSAREVAAEGPEAEGPVRRPSSPLLPPFPPPGSCCACSLSSCGSQKRAGGGGGGLTAPHRCMCINPSKVAQQLQMALQFLRSLTAAEENSDPVKEVIYRQAAAKPVPRHPTGCA